MMVPVKIRYFLVFLLLFVAQCTHTAISDQVVATVSVGLHPNGVAITPDGKFAYVANNNDDNVMGANTVSVIDTATNLVVKTITHASFNQPYTITMNTAGTKAYVTNANGSTVSVIDLATNTVTDVITGFDGPSGFVITPDGTRAYVNDYGAPGGVESGNGNTIRVVDLTTNMITGPAIVLNPLPAPPAAPAALAITPDGAFVYVVNYVDGETGHGTISVIQTSDNTVIETIEAGLSGPFGIVITADGKYAYITNFGSNNFEPVGTTVTVIDLMTNTVSDTIPVGIQPSGIAITPDGKYVYVTNYYTLYLGPMFTDLTAFQGTVNIIRTSDNKVILPTINVGDSPAGIAITPDGKYAYVANYTSNNVNVIGIPQFEVSAEGCKTQDIFLTQKDLINKLTWAVAGADLPIRYQIYRDALLTDLVATVPATEPLLFLDHNRSSDVIYTYYIVGITIAGVISYPVEVTVTQDC